MTRMLNMAEDGRCNVCGDYERDCICDVCEACGALAPSQSMDVCETCGAVVCETCADAHGCMACAPVCERCQDRARDLASARPDDANAPRWCSACRALPADDASGDAPCVDCGAPLDEMRAAYVRRVVIRGAFVDVARVCDSSCAERLEEQSGEDLARVFGKRPGAVCVASYASAHFDFLAVGETEDAARAAMVRGAGEHSRALDLELLSWFFPDDVNVTAVPVGGCARDGAVITDGRVR